jgi:restriction endonuclease Mrr
VSPSLKPAVSRAEDVAVSAELDERERRELRRKARAATLESLRVLGGDAHRDTIRERALADGGFTPRELAAAAPAAAAAKYASLVDHQLSWALTNLKRDGLVENPSRGVWRLAGAALETPTRAASAAVDCGRLRQLEAMSYAEYLRSPEWRRTRAAALERAGYCCSLDVTHTDDLEVHHRTYERLGRELAIDLVVLCRPCHRVHHDEFGRPRRRPDRSPRSVGPPPRLAGATTAAPPSPGKRSLLQRLLAR